MISFDFHRFLLVFWMLPVWKCRQYNTLGWILVQNCRQYNVFVRSWQQKKTDSTTFLNGPGAKIPTVQRFWTVLAQTCRQYIVFGRSWRKKCRQYIGFGRSWRKKWRQYNVFECSWCKNADSTSFWDGHGAKMPTVSRFWPSFVRNSVAIIAGRVSLE